MFAINTAPRPPPTHYTYTNAHTCAHMTTHTCIHTRAFTCMQAEPQGRHTHTHTHTCTHSTHIAHTHMHTRAHPATFTPCSSSRRRTRARTHTHVHTCAHPATFTPYSPSRRRMHTCTHTHTRARTLVVLLQAFPGSSRGANSFRMCGYAGPRRWIHACACSSN